MSTSERRKIFCSVTFHVIAITCVVWSLYVLIDRTAEEIRQGNDNGKSAALPSLPWALGQCPGRGRKSTSLSHLHVRQLARTRPGNVVFSGYAVAVKH